MPTKPITISPLTGVFDLRSRPELIPKDGVRMRQNLQTTAEGKLSRGCGWAKLLTQSSYNNSDFHDQLLDIDGIVAEPDYLIRQDFEGTGYDNGEAWTVSSGSGAMVNPDYTGVILAGSQSLRLFQSGGESGEVASPIFATNSEIWAYFLMRPVDIQVGGFKPFAAFRDTGAVIRWEVTLNADGTVRLGSSGTATSVGAMSEGVTYHCWFHYKAGVSLDFGFSTNGTKPTSGNRFVALTSGLQAGDVTRLILGRNSGVFTCDYVFDKIRVNDEVIGSNPP